MTAADKRRPQRATLSGVKPRRAVRRVAGALVAGVVAVTVVVATAATAPATTGPELIIPMRVTLTNDGMVLSASGRVDLDTTMLFIIENRALGARWFSVGGPRTDVRRTPSLRRGATNRFYYVFRVRGKVPFAMGGPGVRLRAGNFRVV
jgi:hypothetical protein